MVIFLLSIRLCSNNTWLLLQPQKWVVHAPLLYWKLKRLSHDLGLLLLLNKNIQNLVLMHATMIVASDTRELQTLLVNQNKHQKKLSAIFLFSITRYVILVIQNLVEVFLKTMKMYGMSRLNPILGQFLMVHPKLFLISATIKNYRLG